MMRKVWLILVIPFAMALNLYAGLLHVEAAKGGAASFACAAFLLCQLIALAPDEKFREE